MNYRFTSEMGVRAVSGLIIFAGVTASHLLEDPLPALVFTGSFGLALMIAGITDRCFIESIFQSFGIQKDRETLHEIHEGAPVHVRIKKDGTILKCGKGMNALKNYPSDMDHSAFIGENIFEWLNDQDRDTFKTILSGFGEEKEKVPDIHFRLSNSGSSDRWVIADFRPSSGNEVDIFLKDALQSSNSAKSRNDLVLYDSLTGLPGRILFTDRIEQTIRHAKRNHYNFAVLKLRIDNMKEINAEGGILTGDGIVRDSARIIKSCIRDSDSLSRWNASEFLLMIEDISEVDQIYDLVKNIRERVIEHFDNAGGGIKPDCSIGMSFYPDDSIFSQQLIMFADSACRRASEIGSGNIIAYRDMNARNRPGDDEFAVKISTSIKDDLIRLHYQPIFDAKTGEIICVEALARWQDEKMGWVNPAMFISMAENLGLIHELGKKIFEMSFEHFLECRNFDPDLKLAVNVSHRQLVSPSFGGELLTLIGRYGLNPKMIKLEFTETTGILASSQARQTLKTLSEKGVTVSLDDFGTGYSSISHLKNLPVQEIKIDPHFVNLVKDKDGRAIVKSLINIGHALNLDVVGEGVEDEETAEILKECGIDQMQGNFFKPPQESLQCFFSGEQKSS